MRSRKESRDFLVVHGAVDGTLRDLEAINVDDGEDSARLCRVNVLVAMPGGGGRASLGFTIADDTSDDEIRFVHDCTERHAQRVAELTTLMDGSRGLSVNVATDAADQEMFWLKEAKKNRSVPGEAAWDAECSNQVLKAGLVAGVLGPEGAKGALEPEAGEDSGSAVSWADDVEHLLVGLADETVEVRVDEGETWAGTPVTEQTVLDIIGNDVAFDKGIVLQEDHG